jgi:hypothetical protein
MIFKLAQAAEKSWHRLRGHNQLPKVILGVKFNDGIEVVRSQAQAAAGRHQDSAIAPALQILRYHSTVQRVRCRP